MKFMRAIGLTHLELGASMGLTLANLKRQSGDQLAEFMLATDIFRLCQTEDPPIELFQTVAMKPKLDLYPISKLWVKSRLIFSGETYA